MKNGTERAENLLEIGQLLPDDLWAAMIWKYTGVPTAPVAAYQDYKDAPMEYYVSALDRQPLYEAVNLIAMKDGYWDMAAKGKMIGWLGMLADRESYAAAFNSAKNGLRAASHEEAKAALRRGMIRDWHERCPERPLAEMPDAEKVLAGLGVSQAEGMRERPQRRTALELDPFGEEK